jgi:hypothetical protein
MSDPAAGRALPRGAEPGDADHDRARTEEGALRKYRDMELLDMQEKAQGGVSQSAL